MTHMDKTTALPGHLIFGASDYTKIKVQEMPRVGQPGKPVAELTRFGWVLKVTSAAKLFFAIK